MTSTIAPSEATDAPALDPAADAGERRARLFMLVTLSLAKPGAVMMYPGPTFVMYAMNATYFGMRAVAVGLREDFSLDAKAFLEAIREHKPALVYLAYPNNPTGVVYPEQDVLDIIRATEGVVVLDEAYNEYIRADLRTDTLKLLKRHPNLVVTRTFSKAYGLAGLRVGYALAHPSVADVMNRVRQPFNVNSVALCAAGNSSSCTDGSGIHTRDRPRGSSS